MRGRAPLTAILLTALLLRLFRLGGESLWFDEAATLEATRKSWGALLPWLFADWQFPLFHVVEKAFCGLFGRSETALRLPSALFGAAAVAAIHGLGSELRSRRAGLLAALLLAVNPFAIHYAQEARPYSLLLLLALLSARAALRLLRTASRTAAAAHGLWTTAALYTHPHAIFLLPPLAAAPFLLRGDPRFRAIRERPRLLLLAGLLPLLLFLPCVVPLARLLLARLGGAADMTWLRPATVADLPRTWRRWFMDGGAETASIALLLAAIPVAALRNRDARPRRIFLLLAVGSSLLLPWIVSALFTPLFLARYTIPALGALLVALGWSLAGIRRRGPRLAATAALLLLSARPLPDYYGKADKDPWRETAAILRARAVPGDAVIVEAHFAAVALLYYFRPPEGVPVFEAGRDRSPPEGAIEGARRVWHISSYGALTPSRAALRRAAREGRARVETLVPGESLPRNPRLFHMAPIRVTLYE